MKTLLLFIALVLIASTIEAKEQPFASKANKYSQTGFKKHGKKKSNLKFAKVNNRKVNRKGLMR